MRRHAKTSGTYGLESFLIPYFARVEYIERDSFGLFAGGSEPGGVCGPTASSRCCIASSNLRYSPRES